MLNKTLEFLRIADVQPTDEKVRRRTESATALVAQLASEENQNVLLALLQGVVHGFDGTLLTQESPAVVLLIDTIKDKDATLPHDLKENAIELRAVAAIAVGELLTSHPNKLPSEDAILAALSIASALSSRPPAKDKHTRWMLDTLFEASDKVLHSAAEYRRQRGIQALQKLSKMKKPAEGTDAWEVLFPAIKSALVEVSAQEAIDREEIETLWWLFTAYSDVERKPLAELSSLAAAFCSGIELGQRALLPPSPSAVAMVKRAVESGRKASTLGPVSVQDATVDWSESMINSLVPVDEDVADAVSRYPALLPISWACQHLRGCKDNPKLGKEFTATTGIPLNQSQPPTNWGIQVFRERILQRFLSGNEES